MGVNSVSEKKKLHSVVETAGILLLATMSSFSQQMCRIEHTIVPIENIYLEYKSNRLALSEITTRNDILGFLGKPKNIVVFEEEWSDWYEK